MQTDFEQRQQRAAEGTRTLDPELGKLVVGGSAQSDNGTGLGVQSNGVADRGGSGAQTELLFGHGVPPGRDGEASGGEIGERAPVLSGGAGGVRPSGRNEEALRHRFNGPEYEPENDQRRLSKQHIRIRELMLDGQWRTLGEIAARTGDPQASISAQLRHLKKDRFGAFRLEKQRRGDRKRGLYEYRLKPPDPSEIRERSNDSKETIRQLRDELRLLRASAIEAASILESIDMGEGSENDRLEMLARNLRERSEGLVHP